jgi:cobalt-zinc-cadmium efflux system membrane fusion protein
VELSPAAVAAAGIKSEPVVLRAVDEVLSLSGTIGYDENQVARVAPRIGGRVTKILADFGDTVRSGQVLAEIDSPDLGQALADWRKSRSVFTVRQRDYERAQRLLDGKAISQSEFLSREGEFLIAKAEMESKDSHLHLLGLSHDEVARLTAEEELKSAFPLRSPIAGKVIDRQINPGEVVEASKPLFTVGDLSNLWLLARVYEKDLRHLHVGQDVDVSSDALPGETFAGRVDYIGDQVDQDSRTVRARAVLRNPDGKLKPGLFVVAHVVVGSGTPVVVVPASAVQDIDGVATIFVEVTPGVFEPRPIETGRVGKTFVEVVKGIEPKSLVVSQGTLTLKTELLKSELGGDD